jgi:hypothetical protein
MLIPYSADPAPRQGALSSEVQLPLRPRYLSPNGRDRPEPGTDGSVLAALKPPFVSRRCTVARFEQRFLLTTINHNAATMAPLSGAMLVNISDGSKMYVRSDNFWGGRRGRAR